MKKIKEIGLTSPKQYLQSFSANRTNKQLNPIQQNMSQILNMDQLPLIVKIYLNTLEKLVNNRGTQLSKLACELMPETFIKAFSQLSSEQKRNFLHENVSYINQSYKNKQPDGSLNYSNQSMIKTIDTDCHLKRFKAGLPYWTKVSFKYNGSKRQLKLNYKRQVHFIDLRLYLARKSKKQKSSLILISCSDLNHRENDKIQLSFPQSIFSSIHYQVNKCIIDFRCMKVRQLIQINIQHSIHQLVSKQTIHEKVLKIVDSYKIMKYLHKKKEFIEQIQDMENQFIILHTEQYATISINSKVQNSYKMECQFSQTEVQQLKEKFLHQIQQLNCDTLVEQQILQKFQKKYKAVFQKYKIVNAFYEIIAIKQQQKNQNNSYIYFLKGVTGVSKTYPFLHFMAVKAERARQGSNLIINANFQEDQDFGADQATPFLLQFKNMIQKPFKKAQVPININKSNQSGQSNEGSVKIPILTLHELQSIEDYYTIDESIDQNQMFPTSQLIQHEQQQKGGKIPKDTNNTSMSGIAKQDRFLNHKFIINPLNLDPKNRKYVKKLQVFIEWKRKKNGGFVCINKKDLDLQKSVIPTLANNIRKMIMSGKNPLNSSLPVQIFRKQSHLKAIARNFIYAPILLQPYVNSEPLTRIKAVIPTMITIITLGIMLAKPFNPILGQTAQFWIDGCPVYLQQVSHHPPVGYYNFYGRGYKIYGGIQPDVKFGMNNLTATSKFPQYISFENGDFLNCGYAPMIMSGFLFGDRQFKFGQKMFTFDQKNRLFVEFRFGPKNKSIFGNSAQPEDYCQCSIYKVTEQFVAYWNNIEPTYPQRKDIVQQISKGNGIWNQYFNIDGREVLNYSKDFPCELVDQKFPLMSDSSYRQDLQKLIQGDLQQSQRFKDQMEENQRRDRKLRQKMRKN